MVYGQLCEYCWNVATVAELHLGLKDSPVDQLKVQLYKCTSVYRS